MGNTLSNANRAQLVRHFASCLGKTEKLPSDIQNVIQKYLKQSLNEMIDFRYLKGGNKIGNVEINDEKSMVKLIGCYSRVLLISNQHFGFTEPWKILSVVIKFGPLFVGGCVFCGFVNQQFDYAKPHWEKLQAQGKLKKIANDQKKLRILAKKKCEFSQKKKNANSRKKK